MSNPYPEYKRNTITVPATVASASTMQAEINRLVSFNNDLMDELARLQKREWVGLMDDELNDLTAIYSGMPLYRAIEAKLRSNNT